MIGPGYDARADWIDGEEEAISAWSHDQSAPRVKTRARLVELRRSKRLIFHA